MTATENLEATTEAPAEDQTEETTPEPAAEVKAEEPKAPAKPRSRGGKAKPEEPAPTTQAQEVLFSKGDIADLVGMSTQALANRASRDPEFPKPTYTNQSNTVQLYTKADIKAISDYLTRPDRERIERLNAALGNL